MDVVESASNRWNALVKESGPMREIVRDLAGERMKPHFLIPGFAKLVVLRPLFMSREQNARLKAASEVVLSAHRKVIHAVLEDDELKKLHFSGFFEWTERVLCIDRPGPVHATCLRFDGSLVDGDPVFIELNADMPQGLGISDSFADFLVGLPVTGEFEKETPVKPGLLREAFLEALLAEWEVWGGTGSPRICFVTWRDEPVRYKDMGLDCEYFASRGYEAFTADPRELEYDGGKLAAHGKEVDLVYRVVSTGETLDRPGEMEALIEAEKAGAVLMVNSFRSELLGNKAVFALLHDESCRSALTAAEREAVNACIPWTRVMREDRCFGFSGETIDLVDWVVEHRGELVLKPTHDFGGHGVTIGSDSTVGEWEEAVKIALENDFIVQRKIALGTGVYPLAEEGIPLKELFEDVDAVMLGNSYAGCISRLSEDELTNVHLHGAIGAVFELSGGQDGSPAGVGPPAVHSGLDDPD